MFLLLTVTTEQQWAWPTTVGQNPLRLTRSRRKALISLTFYGRKCSKAHENCKVCTKIAQKIALGSKKKRFLASQASVHTSLVSPTLGEQ